MTTRAAAFPAYPRQKVRLTTRIGNWLLGTNAALVFGFLYLPVLILIIFSFNNTRSVAVFTGFSTEWYTALAQNEELLDAARNSLLVGVITTIAATLIGTLTALAMERYRFKLRTTFDANLYLPIVIPEIVMGIALLLFFNQALFPFLQNVFGLRATSGLHTITISHIAFDIPFVYVIVRARLADFDRSLEEAAANLGASWSYAFRRVVLPLILPGVLGGALLAFVHGFGEFVASILIYTPANEPLSVAIYTRMYSFEFGTAAAYGVLQILLIFVVLNFTSRLGQGQAGPVV